MVDREKLVGISVESVLKTRTRALILTLNSKEAVVWLKDPCNEVTFSESFAAGSHTSRSEDTT